ncbi:MAG: hypothetical protein DMG15_29120 [Acidobacteria bacterium]|nr:MAG: hypothetical protein DMG15_29120 [Acidobacteriota bacterium]
MSQNTPDVKPPAATSRRNQRQARGAAIPAVLEAMAENPPPSPLRMREECKVLYDKRLVKDFRVVPKVL